MTGPRRVDTGHGYLLQLTFTPDGEELLTTGMDGTVWRWSVPDLGHLATWEGHERSVNWVAVSPAGDVVAAGQYCGRVAAWRLDGEPVAAFPAAGKLRVWEVG